MKQAGQTKPSSTVSDGGAAGSERCRPRPPRPKREGRAVGHTWTAASFRLEFEIISLATGDTPDAFFLSIALCGGDTPDAFLYRLLCGVSSLNSERDAPA